MQPFPGRNRPAFAPSPEKTGPQRSREALAGLVWTSWAVRGLGCAPSEQMSSELFTSDGQRKYLTAEERQAFHRGGAGSAVRAETRTFCETLAQTGCRISEALPVLRRSRPGRRYACARSLRKPPSGEYMSTSFLSSHSHRKWRTATDFRSNPFKNHVLSKGSWLAVLFFSSSDFQRVNP